jgi:hypothetical protein
MYRHGIETGLLRERTATNRLSHRTAWKKKEVRKVYKNSGCCLQREQSVCCVNTNRLISVEFACVWFVNHTVLESGGAHWYCCCARGQGTARIEGVTPWIKPPSETDSHTPTKGIPTCYGTLSLIVGLQAPHTGPCHVTRAPHRALSCYKRPTLGPVMLQAPHTGPCYEPDETILYLHVHCSKINLIIFLLAHYYTPIFPTGPYYTPTFPSAHYYAPIFPTEPYYAPTFPSAPCYAPICP